MQSLALIAALGLALVSFTSRADGVHEHHARATLCSRAEGPQALDTAGAQAKARRVPKPHPVVPAHLQEADGSPAEGYDLSAHQTLSRVVLLIRENYVEPDRIKPYEMFLAALDFIQRTVPQVLVDDSQAPARITISVGSTSRAFDLGSIDELWEVTMALRDIFRFLQTHISDPAKQQDIEYAAINGMLSTLDPHSILLKPENFDEVKLSTRGEFGGLGIVISIRDGGLTIIAPIEGTPAGAAGLRAKDKIVKIGEESTVNMALDEAVQILRGAPDTQVTISVQRKGWTEPKDFVLTRAIIKIESVTSELLPDGVGYIKIKSFQGNTFDDLQAHLTALKKRNHNADLRGLVLDLRNNPGGLLDQAILVSDRFISRGPLVITVGEGARRREVKNAHPGADEDSYPMAVLLNGGSASASEIVAGALKNHGRAVVIGQQSFGKGSVQVLYDFKDRSALKLTIAQYLTPGDISIQSVGVVPDVAVVPAVVQKSGIHLFVDDDAPREKDLERHLSQHGPSTLTTSLMRINHLSAQESLDLDPNSPAQGSQAALIDKHDEEIASGKFEFDFETHVAHDVLRASKSHKREEMLQQALPLLQERLAAEQQSIAGRMQELGVRWVPCDAAAGTAPNALQAAHVKLETGHGKNAIVAGGTLTLTATVTNTSDTPLCQIYGVTSSDSPLFRGLEFAFGEIAPHKSRSWPVDIKLPADMPPQANSITLALGRGQEKLSQVTGETQVEIAEKKQPSFAYSVRIDDSAGNGDGMLQAGEQVTLRVGVHNMGPGPAEDVTVTLKNLAHGYVFLDSGRAKVGAIGAGEMREAELRFRVNGPQADSAPKVATTTDAEDDTVVRVTKVPEVGTELLLKLGIWDGALGASLTESLRFVVAPPMKKRAALGAVQVRDARPAPIFTGASEQSGTLGTLRQRSVVAARANWGPFVEVALGDKVSGFVLAKDVQPAAQNAKNRSRGVKARADGAQGFARGAPHGPPELHLPQLQLVVHDDHMRVQGSITSSRPIKDVFVFVGDKKVFFRALDDLTPHEGVYRYVLDVPVKLKEGSNPVVVVARENEDLMARKWFSILRRSAHQPAHTPPLAPGAQPRL